ncbi:MAG: DoxX family protein [Marivirga sp.]|nr:DoxX family protein [Marivirga sp.]
MSKFFSSSPIWSSNGIAVVRIVLGALMIYHGQEVFNPELMNTYLEWDTFKSPEGKLMVYAGKSSEFIAGISLFFGLFTRLGALLLMGTLSYITFFVGHGRFWYEDQHPFMFVLFGLLFLFTGPGSWSLDALIFRRASSH